MKTTHYNSEYTVVNRIASYGHQDALKTRGDEIILGQDDSCIDNGASSSFFIDD
jgi:hypothetical protein